MPFLQIAFFAVSQVLRYASLRTAFLRDAFLRVGSLRDASVCCLFA